MIGKYIRNEKHLLEGFIDYGVFDGAFSNPKARFTDGDAMAEINSNLLLVEVKHISARQIPLGQKILIEGLQKTTVVTTMVLYFDGKDENGYHQFKRMTLYRPNGVVEHFEEIDNDFVLATIRKWEAYAKSNSIGNPLTLARKLIKKMSVANRRRLYEELKAEFENNDNHNDNGANIDSPAT